MFVPGQIDAGRGLRLDKRDFDQAIRTFHSTKLSKDALIA